jgi:hypothetical protein
MNLPLPAKPTGGHGFETNAFVSVGRDFLVIEHNKHH